MPSKTYLFTSILGTPRIYELKFNEITFHVNYAGIFPVPTPHTKLWWCMFCYLQTLILQDCLGKQTHEVRIRKEGV